MKFIDTKTNKFFEVSDRYTKISKNEDLAKYLLKPIAEVKNTSWNFEIFATTKSILDVAQVKINIKNVGAIFVSFNKETFTVETKNSLFEKLLTLKDIDTTKSLAELKRKTSAVFNFLEEYHPYFAVVDFTQNNNDVELMMINLEQHSFPIILIRQDYPMIDLVIGGVEEPAPEKKNIFKSLFQNKKKEESLKEEPLPVIEEPVHKEEEPIPFKEEEPKEEIHSFEEPKYEEPTFEKPKSKFDFKGEALGSLKNIVKYKVDYILNALYSLLIGVTMFLTVTYFQINNTGIGALFIAFTLASIGLSVYNIVVARKDQEKVGVFDYVYFVIISIIGALLGILVGWLIATAFVAKGETTVEFGKVFLIGGLLTPVGIAAAEGIATLTIFLIKVIKKKKNK